jgi:hypothetical protein
VTVFESLEGLNCRFETADGPCMNFWKLWLPAPYTDLRGLRGWLGGLLANALAVEGQRRGVCHSCRQHCGVAGAPAKTDRHDTELLKRAFLGWRRTGSLQDSGGTNAPVPRPCRRHRAIGRHRLCPAGRADQAGAQARYTVGLMFWLWRNKFVGSYLFFRTTSRS